MGEDSAKLSGVEPFHEDGALLPALEVTAVALSPCTNEDLWNRGASPPPLGLGPHAGEDPRPRLATCSETQTVAGVVALDCRTGFPHPLGDSALAGVPVQLEGLGDRGH